LQSLATKVLIVFVRLDITRVSTRHIPNALTLMARQRLSMRNLPGLTFYKLMGTGSGKTFTIRDADLHHWCVLSVWESYEDCSAFLSSKPAKQWQKLAMSQANIELEPLSAKGTWAKKTPFGNPVPEKWDGLTAALTRASIKPRWWREFWRSVPPVSQDLNASAGLITSLGIGEAPIGLQGTFSIWKSNESITAFSSKQKPHADVIARTHETGWYSEELFSRFKVTKLTGSFAGIDFSKLDK